MTTTMTTHDVSQRIGITRRELSKFCPHLRNFPKPVGKCRRGGYLFCAADVLAWAQTHDIKHEITEARKRHNRPLEQISPFNARATAFLSRPMIKG